MKNLLCFGDSNTWGYNPANGERFPENVRWTGLLRDSLKDEDVNVLEDGLCGRTTVYEDSYREGRKGVDSIRDIFSRGENVNAVVLMLGTNDCKTCNHTTPEAIAEGIDKCLDVILENVPSEKVLLISPILLGENVWKEGFDPEFCRRSVKVSRGLKSEYSKVARKRHVRFMAASDLAAPSITDQEHLSADDHKIMADAIYKEVRKMVS